MKYEFNKGTLAIVPNEENSCLVYEDDERYIIADSAFHVMEESCIYFGSRKTVKGSENESGCPGVCTAVPG